VTTTTAATTTTASTTSTTAGPKARVATLYEAFGRGDVPAILDQLADDVAWDGDWVDNWAQTKFELSYFRPRRGIAEAAEFFASLAEITIHEFVVHEIIGGDDSAVARVTIEFTSPSGTRVRDEELHLWRFDSDGKVVSLRHYVDTLKHAAASGKDLAQVNKEIARQLWGCVSTGDFDRMAELYDENVVYHGAGDEQRVGRAAAVEHARMYKTAFPDLAVQIETVLAEGDLVFTRVRPTGTQTNPLGDLPATGSRVELKWVMNLVKISGGKVVEEWEIFDSKDFEAQLMGTGPAA
jgi:predicted ester cyclase